MENETICSESKLGQRLEGFNKVDASHLLFMGKGISLISKITLGRNKKNSIVLDGKMVSRFHAEIQKIAHDYFVRDLNSANGTYVNEIPVPKGKYLKLNDGDVIRVGKHEIKLVKSKPSVYKLNQTVI